MLAPIWAPLSIILLGNATVAVPNFGWSPSSDRVAFVIATPTAVDSLRAFPLFPRAEQPPSSVTPPGDVSWSIWAVRPGGESVLVDRGPLPRSSPAWSRDGNSLAFVRVAAGPGPTEAAFEVASVDAEATVVLYRESFDFEVLRDDRFSGQSIAWAGPGDRLAVPHPDGRHFAIVDAIRSARIGALVEGCYPAFRPIGDRIAYYRPSSGDGWELVVATAPDQAGPPLAVPVTDAPTQPPLWSADGRKLLFLNRRPLELEEGSQVGLYALDVGSGAVSELKPIENSVLPGEFFRSASFTIGPDGFDQFYRVATAQRPAVIAQHLGRMPMDRFHPFGGSAELWAPALSPSGNWLALRFGEIGARSVVGLYDLGTKSLTPVAPDADASAAWIRTLGEAAEPSTFQGSRPTRLPLRLENEEGDAQSSAMKRIADLGRPLLDALEGQAGPIPEATPAALFFEYLDGDDTAAGRSLDRLIRETSDRDRTLRLLGLRAQIALDQGRDGEAREILDYVERQEPKPTSRVEPDGNGGLSILRDEGSKPHWPEALWRHHHERRTGPVQGRNPPEQIVPPTPEYPPDEFPRSVLPPPGAPR